MFFGDRLCFSRKGRIGGGSLVPRLISSYWHVGGRSLGSNHLLPVPESAQEQNRMDG